MFGPIAQRDQGSRHNILGYWPFLAVYAFFALCFFIDMVFIPGWSQMLIRPSFMLMCVFYCAIYRPNLLPFGLLFLAGICFDAAADTHLGLHALIWMGAFWTIRAQRRFLLSQPFLMLWLIYAVTAALAGILSGRLDLANITGQGDPLAMVAAFFISLFFFPPVALVLHLLHRNMPLNR